jgi:hypothetical protein
VERRDCVRAQTAVECPSILVHIANQTERVSGKCCGKFQSRWRTNPRSCLTACSRIHAFDDVFVVRYSARAQAALRLHTDAGEVSFMVRSMSPCRSQAYPKLARTNTALEWSWTWTHGDALKKLVTAFSGGVIRPSRLHRRRHVV